MSAGKKLFDNEIEELIDAEECAKRLATTKHTIRKWRYTGYLPDYTMYKLGRSVKYRWDVIVRWLQERNQSEHPSN